MSGGHHHHARASAVSGRRKRHKGGNRRNSVHLFRGYFSRRDDDRRGMLRRVRGATQTTEIDVPGGGRLRLARTNEREKMDQDDWCARYDCRTVRYCLRGRGLPKDRYQRLALPMYADSGKKFDPCEMPKKWLKPLGPPLRKLYLCFFWNDICKVMYKDMYWGAKRLRDWNQETEADEERAGEMVGRMQTVLLRRRFVQLVHELDVLRVLRNERV